MKKKLVVVFLVVMFFMFLGDVKALKMYNNFKEGDKINVYVTDDTVGEFTVLKDESDYVIAIYNTYYGNEDSLYEFEDAKKIIDKIKKDWINVWGVRFLSANEIVKDFNNTDTEFKSPSWAMMNFPYWTSTVINLDSKKTPFYVENWLGYSIIKSGVSGDTVNTKAYVRPIIQVKKEWIKEGVNPPKNWNEFVEYYIEFLEYYIEFFAEDVNYTYDDKGLNISLISPDGKADAKYSFDGKFLTFIEEKGSKGYEYFFTDNLLEYISIVLPFDYEKEIMSCITESGINCDNFKFIVDNDNDGEVLEFKVNLNYFFGFSNNSINDNIDNQANNEVVKNPKTNDINILFVGVGVLLVGFGIILGTRKLKKLSK